MCLDVFILNASLLREIILVEPDVFHNYAKRRPKSLLREKIDKSMVCIKADVEEFSRRLRLKEYFHRRES